MKRIVFLAVTGVILLYSIPLYADEVGEIKREIGELRTRIEALENRGDKGISGEIDELKKRVEELGLRIKSIEKGGDSDLAERLEVVEAEKDDIAEKVSRLVQISGYADGEFIITDKEGDNNRFRVHHLSLFFKKDLTERWRLFSEVEYEDAPKIESGTTEGEIFIEVFYIEYMHSPYINFRLGRTLTPAGIWNVEHYPPFVPTQERPQHIKLIFPQVTDGLQFYGATNIGQVVTDYILYVGNGSGNTGHGDGNEDKAIGGRLKFKLPLLSSTEVGLSAYTEKDNSNLRRKSYGTDLRLHWKNLRFQGEYARGNFDPATGSDYHRTGYYAQLIYDYNAWSFIYRYDWYEPDSTVDDDEKTINTIALNYHFTPSIVGKAEHHFVNPESPSQDDYNLTIFSVAVYLGD